MRRVNLALFLITVAIVLCSLLRSVVGGAPSVPTQGLARRSPAGRPPQATLAELNRRPSIDCSLALERSGPTVPAGHVGAPKLPAKASAQTGSQKKKL